MDFKLLEYNKDEEGLFLIYYNTTYAYIKHKEHGVYKPFYISYIQKMKCEEINKNIVQQYNLQANIYYLIKMICLGKNAYNSLMLLSYLIDPYYNRDNALKFELNMMNLLKISGINMIRFNILKQNIIDNNCYTAYCINKLLALTLYMYYNYNIKGHFQTYGENAEFMTFPESLYSFRACNNGRITYKKIINSIIKKNIFINLCFISKKKCLPIELINYIYDEYSSIDIINCGYGWEL